jgi:hypothetical protein
MADYLNDLDVSDDDDDGYDEEDENIIPLDDIAYSLTTRGGTQMIINEREIFIQNKVAKKRNADGMFNVSWNCKDYNCTGRLNSHKQNGDDVDINVRRTEGNNYDVKL